MSATLGTGTQISAAKESIKQALSVIPASTPVALRAYAHRYPQTDKLVSCTDSELMIPFGPVNLQQFYSAVDSLQPKGFTPIAYSLRESAKDFQGTGTKHVIILLSDGEETCGGDPVAEAQNLLAQGYGVVIHTIGFRVDEKTRAQLSAISSATGGTYFDAVDQASLGKQLKEATQKALLLNKVAEEVRGKEIRGGNGYSSAVPIEAGIEYKLDHHQRKAEYDYFYIDVKKGQKLTATISTGDVGVEIEGGQAKERGTPDAGIRVMDRAFKEIASKSLHGRSEQEKIILTAPKADARYYVLIGSSDEMHKDSPFKLAVDSYSDAGSGGDAGEDIVNATPITAGEHPENWITDKKDGDVYRLDVLQNEEYDIVIEPKSMDLELRASIYDRDRVKKANESARNRGAILRFEKIKAGYSGPMYIEISTPNYIDIQPSQYSIAITARAVAALPVPAPAVDTTNTAPSAPVENIAPVERPSEEKKTDILQKKIAEKKPKKSSNRTSITKYVFYGMLVLLMMIAIFGTLVFFMVKKKKNISPPL